MSCVIKHYCFLFFSVTSDISTTTKPAGLKFNKFCCNKSTIKHTITICNYSFDYQGWKGEKRLINNPFIEMVCVIKLINVQCGQVYLKIINNKLYTQTNLWIFKQYNKCLRLSTKGYKTNQAWVCSLFYFQLWP